MVELLVDTATIRLRMDHIVGVRIGHNEQSLQTVVRAAGVTWDYKANLWCMARRIAGILRLIDRISEK